MSAYSLPGWTLIGNPALADSIGTFTNLKVPYNSPFALEFTSSGYRNAYSQDILLTQGGPLANFILMSTADYGALGWPLTAGRTFLRGITLDSLDRPLDGVSLTASSVPANSYTVQYVNDSNNGLDGTSTFTNGLFVLDNAVPTTAPTDNLSLTATKAGKVFTPNQPSFSHMVADSDSLGIAFDTSLPPGSISASPSPVSFGSVNLGSSATPQQITITNSGPGPITVSTTNQTGDLSEINIQPGGSAPCPASLPATLAAGASCTLVATFTPTSTGPKLATMTIGSDAVNPVFPLTMSGTSVATVPGAPTINSIIPGNGQITVNFTAPTFNGGSPIDNYSVLVDPGPPFVSSPVSPITVTGLTNGQQLSVTVTAHNGVGSSNPASTSYYLPLLPGVSDLQGVVTAAASDAAIWTMDGAATLTTPPLLITKGLTLSGGYNSDYSAVTGYTTITGIKTGTNPGGVQIRGTGYQGDLQEYKSEGTLDLTKPVYLFKTTMTTLQAVVIVVTMPRKRGLAWTSTKYENGSTCWMMYCCASSTSAPDWPWRSATSRRN